MNNMGKTQNRIAVDVVLLPPDAIMDKAIEVNQALLKKPFFKKEGFTKEILNNNKIMLTKGKMFPTYLSYNSSHQKG